MQRKVRNKARDQQINATTKIKTKTFNKNVSKIFGGLEFIAYLCTRFQEAWLRSSTE